MLNTYSRPYNQPIRVLYAAIGELGDDGLIGGWVVILWCGRSTFCLSTNRLLNTSTSSRTTSIQYYVTLCLIYMPIHVQRVRLLSPGTCIEMPGVDLSFCEC